MIIYTVVRVTFVPSHEEADEQLFTSPPPLSFILTKVKIGILVKSSGPNFSLEQTFELGKGYIFDHFASIYITLLISHYSR